jgi:hypothetical protein
MKTQQFMFDELDPQKEHASDLAMAEDDRGERTRAGSALQGVCKDCGAGTLNNNLNPAFEITEDGIRCYCGSYHVDVL